MLLGLLASSFDPFHPGYIWAMSQAIQAGACESVIAALHIDPSVEYDGPQPIMTVDERGYLLINMQQVSDVIPYETKQDLRDLLATTRPAVRILGDDCIGKPYVGNEFPIPIFYAKWRNNWGILEFVKGMTRATGP